MSLSIYSYHLFSTRCNRCCQQFDIKSLLFSQISIQHFLYIVYHAVHKKWEVEEQGRRKQSKFGWAYSMRLKTIIFWIHIINQKLDGQISNLPFRQLLRPWRSYAIACIIFTVLFCLYFWRRLQWMIYCSHHFDAWFFPHFFFFAVHKKMGNGGIYAIARIILTIFFWFFRRQLRLWLKPQQPHFLTKKNITFFFLYFAVHKKNWEMEGFMLLLASFWRYFFVFSGGNSGFDWSHNNPTSSPCTRKWRRRIRWWRKQHERRTLYRSSW